jgi:hypothetical protein
MIDFVPESFKKEEKLVKPKLSPYREFTNWLLNSNLDIELKPEVLKGLNPIGVLCLFGGVGRVTVYLNKHFNNYGLMYLDQYDFYKFLKIMTLKFNIKRHEFSYFASEKTDKPLQEMHKKFPYLKRYEVYNFLEMIKDDPEYNSFSENLGLNKTKKSKSKTVEVVSTFDISMGLAGIDKIKSFSDWKKCFHL